MKKRRLIEQRAERQATKAVAIQWDRVNAPRVTAAGTGASADEIIEIAAEHGIPLECDPVLTEALAQIPIGDEIPQSLYVAVAEVLSFVFMLEGIDPRETHGGPTR